MLTFAADFILLFFFFSFPHCCFFLICLLVMEIITLPVGPNEIGELWYARSRIAVANCVVWLQGHKCGPHGTWVIVSTRVLEKLGELSAAILWEILRITGLKESDIEELHVWSDVGHHYRCWKWLAHSAWMS